MKVMILAGEQSGDVYGAQLVESLKRSRAGGGIEFRGTGGAGMKAAGVETVASVEDMAVIGITPVIAKLPFFISLSRRLKRMMREWRPDLLLTVDYPGMNLRMCAYAKKLGIPAVHVVCPQVWAWKSSRIPKIMASVDRLLCFFPFEPGLFHAPEGSTFKAVFIGHPLADAFRLERLRERIPLPWGDGTRRVALLPGSRLGEISRNLPALLDTAVLLSHQYKGGPVKFLIPSASERVEKIIRLAISRRDDAGGIVECLPPGCARDVLLTADVAAVASGTATLEAALARVPTVLVYKVGFFFATLCRFLLRRLKNIGIGLANIVAGRQIMPELLQKQFTPQALADILDSWLSDGIRHSEMKKTLNDAVSVLEKGTAGAIENATEEILAVLPVRSH